MNEKVRAANLKPETLPTAGELEVRRETMSRRQTPSEFLNQIRGRPVVVKLNSGVDYRGVLSCLDGYMNIALEQTEEYVNGQLKNKYGDAFIRGNNVLYISTQKRR
ncbi:U6 snRNA-associated Sm-like protein LSm6 isoform X1 [Biomphalaria glabrata]|uniref:U6 snRNA-associated Sm-like protein LSm6 n=1 Tax=Biomphalaria glabrata TaxID=6526 RepID=A0A9W3BEH6_BIOGL|nr:U6 snRNA-associated Sm-like protein LSm6 isoform X1 [Biomphalaria glabrata]